MRLNQSLLRLITRQKINAANPAIKPSTPAASISLSVLFLTGWIQEIARDDSASISASLAWLDLKLVLSDSSFINELSKANWASLIADELFARDVFSWLISELSWFILAWSIVESNELDSVSSWAMEFLRSLLMVFDSWSLVFEAAVWLSAVEREAAIDCELVLASLKESWDAPSGVIYARKTNIVANRMVRAEIFVNC